MVIILWIINDKKINTRNNWNDNNKRNNNSHCFRNNSNRNHHPPVISHPPIVSHRLPSPQSLCFSTIGWCPLRLVPPPPPPKPETEPYGSKGFLTPGVPPEPPIFARNIWDPGLQASGSQVVGPWAFRDFAVYMYPGDLDSKCYAQTIISGLKKTSPKDNTWLQHAKPRRREVVPTCKAWRIVIGLNMHKCVDHMWSQNVNVKG